MGIFANHWFYLILSVLVMAAVQLYLSYAERSRRMQHPPAEVAHRLIQEEFNA